MIELQGEVVLRPGLLEANRQIGTLALSATSKGVVELTVGYHQLSGKIVPLKKPFAVLEKVEAEDTQETKRSQYKVIGVVRQKCLFKTRPKPLITKPMAKVNRQ